MNFTEAVTEVLSIVKRPDKLNDIRRAINSTISTACLGTDFARDHDEVEQAISSSAYAGSLALNLFPRFRKVSYILPAGYLKPLENINPANVFQQCQQRTDAFYVTGDTLVYNLSRLADTVKVGYFRYPPVLTDASPDFWLLEASPYMIIDGAAAYVFRHIGDDASARQHESSWRMMYDSARVDFKYGAVHGA